jgi:hypothetical protein
MRSLEELHFIRDRVLAEIHANPPRGPLLVETPPARTSASGVMKEQHATRTVAASHVNASGTSAP